LLPNEADAVEHLPRALRGSLESPLQRGVLVLELRAPVGELALVLTRRLGVVPFQLAHARLRQQRPSAEARELVPEMANELLKLAEGGNLRSNAVGH
jgi:hypothetical protein